MAYESPINLVMGTPQTTVEEIRDGITGLIEKEIVNTLVKLRVNVDKDELIKALEYDRKQYEKGYADAIADGTMVVRCKDCKHRDPEDKKCDCGHDILWQLPRRDDWFCADGERREVTT